MSLNGKVAIVTGAGRGIGREVAFRFASAGVKVVLASRTKDEIEAVSLEIASRGGEALAVPTDVNSESDIKKMVTSAEEHFGPVDILVNNAGMMILKPLAETSPDELNKVVGTNLIGPFLCAKAVLPSMMSRKSGRIINIGSLAGRQGYTSQGAYCASKHGLAGLTKVLAIECKPHNIRVNMISPGGVLTSLSSNLLASRGTDSSEWMTPEEVADAVLYVAKQEGTATTDELVLRRFASEPWR
jgi:NAD(P)-dependent dehydrogenase (short-subunit alcohol dehydrogenase family)